MLLKYALVAAAVFAVAVTLGYRQAMRHAEPAGLRGLAALAPDVQARVRAALDGGALALPDDVAALAGPHETLMGGQSPAAFRIIAPAGIAVATDRPTFAWEPLDGGDDYWVTIVDDLGKPIGPPMEARGPVLVLLQSLPRGRDYTWQVSATRGGTRVTVPAPPDPPARFRVLDKATADRLAAVESAHPDSHVLLGLLYLQAGAVLESLKHFHAVPPEDSARGAGPPRHRAADAPAQAGRRACTLASAAVGDAGPTMQASADRQGEVAALERFGADAVSFQSLESGLAWWRDAPAPEGTGAALAYRDTGRSWIAVGTPLVESAATTRAAGRFAAAAREQNRRAVFFGVEQVDAFAGFRRLALGLQSVLQPECWPATLGASRKLREQLRRARAKGVTVRLASAAEVAPGTALRGEVERLRREWLGTRPMEPMGFLVAVEPFHAAPHHLYVVAERQGRVVQFLSAVPAFASRGWLFEDMLRGPDAPNGTTELVLDLALRTIAGTAVWATPGLTPLAGPITWWLRAARTVTTPLYDFDGLRRFRARLAPARWVPVWLVWDRGPAWLVLLDVLRAFACGPLTAFAWRSLTRHPNGPPWAVALPLVPWTGLLIGLLSAGAAGTLGFSAPALAGWVIFDIALAWLLFQAARRPVRRHLAWLALAAGVDATISVHHLTSRGLGPDATSAVLRLAATAGPIVGTAALAWAARLASRRHRPVTRRG